MAKYLLFLFFFVIVPLSAQAETVYIQADRDNTLFEDPMGEISNGSGPVFFVGRSSPSQLAPYTMRRGLIHFDVAQIPSNAIIEYVSLTLHLSNSSLDGPGTTVVSLHRMLDSWGEGVSSGTGGLGDNAEPDDATWIHMFYPDTFWVHEGGHFVDRSSAELIIGSFVPCTTFACHLANNFYTWEDTNHLVQDVRLWVHAPDQNFGWTLVGDESIVRTARRFDSRENSNPQFRPVLSVTYRMPGENDEPIPGN
jgi:hypothetical protein